MPTTKAIHAWLPDSEIVNGLTNTGFKLDLLNGERSTAAVPGERKVHTSCSARTTTGTTCAGFKTPPSLGERKVHTSCSGRTSAALRKLRYSPGWSPESKPSEGSSCQTRLPFTPDGSQSCTGTNLSGPSPDVCTPLSVLREGANHGVDSPCVVATVLGQKSGPLERILQPVLVARAVEDCLGPPGSPPRRAGGLRKLCVQQNRASLPPEEHKEPQQAPPLSSRSQPSRWKPWPGATPSPGPSSFSMLSALSAEMELMCRDDDAPPEQQRTQTPAGVRETIHASEVYGNKGKNCIFRGYFDDGVNKIEQDRKDLALHRRDVEKAAKDCDRASVVKWAAVHQRRQQVYQLRAMVSDPEVRRAFIPRDAPCDGKGGHTTPAELTQQELDDLAHPPARVEMPATVHSRDALCTTEEEYAAATKLKKKQNLQARLKVLKKVAKERRAKEMQDGEQDIVDALLEGSAKKDGGDRLEVRSVLANLTVEKNTPRGSHSTGTKSASLQIDPSASPPSRSSGLYQRRTGKDKLLLRSDTKPLGLAKEGSEPSSPGTPKPISARHQRQQEVSSKMSAIRRKAFSDQVAKHRERELHLLQEAFGQHDVDGNHALDHGEVRSCLASLGIVGKNQPERRVLRNVLWQMDKLLFNVTDLSEHIIPALRKQLLEVRQPRLLELFDSFDRLARMRLSIEETLDGLRRLGMVIREEIKERVVEIFCYESHGDWVHSLDEAILSPPAFVAFVSILGEQADRHKAELFRTISGKLNLAGEGLKDWQHDLVDLYCQFHEYDPVSGKYGSSVGKLTEQEFSQVIRASGYMPKTRARQAGLTQSFHELQRSDGTIGFEGFLSIMRRLRDFDRERLWRVLENWLHDAVVTYSDISEMLPECGVVCRNVDEEKEVHAMMEEHDEDGLGVFCAQECIPLLQQMCRKMRMIQHERERQYVISAGWSLHHFVEFRHAFQIFDEDSSEFLDCDELMKAVELLRGSYWQSQQNIDLMFVALGINTGKEIKVNFFTFLRMMKMLDESETRRQQGLSVGFSRDRTDMLYSIFQALEPESDGTLSRRTLEQIMIGLSEALTKTQIQDLGRMINVFPLQIEFRAFLRVLKALDGIMEIDLEVLQGGWKKSQKLHYDSFADFASKTDPHHKEGDAGTP